MNQLILGDCLEVLKKLEPESVDLIYLDPPFFSNRNYEVIWGDKGEVRSFEDRWSGGIDHYIAWLKERVAEMYRVLKPTGSIFLHCDWHADAYIRVFILDKIFGQSNFRNEIIWHYNSGGRSTKDFSRKHDSIFRYTKTAQYVFNADDISELRGTQKRNNMKKNIDEDGRVYFSIKTNGKLYKYYEDSKITPDDVWNMSHLQQKDPERIGYPTQKPEALLERIIKCATNEGDIVLDPFVGGGTTIAVADKLKREWIGIDSSASAINVAKLRLQKNRPDLTITTLAA
jgi:DNA modification methylase